jgi:Family of unknown function (DUF6011)
MNYGPITEQRATERQQAYMLDLLEQKELKLTAGITLEQLKEDVPKLSKSQASKWIDRLVKLPRKQKESKPAIQSDVPAGRYAVTGDDGTTDFYRVDRPTEGRWAGYTFVKLQLSDEFHRVPFKNTQAILDKIAEAGPEAASKRYGLELGACGVCGRTLTNPESIERGIGPVCARRMDWSF